MTADGKDDAIIFALAVLACPLNCGAASGPECATLQVWGRVRTSVRLTHFRMPGPFSRAAPASFLLQYSTCPLVAHPRATLLVKALAPRRNSLPPLQATIRSKPSSLRARTLCKATSHSCTRPTRSRYTLTPTHTLTYFHSLTHSFTLCRH